MNHVEYFALKCGFSVERIQADYGYDLHIYCYDDNGEFENGVIYLQLKSTDNIGKCRRTDGYSYSFENEHLEIWTNEPMPVIIVLFDAANEIAYWTYLQAFVRKTGIRTKSGKKTFTIRFSENNVVGTEDVRKWKKYKDRILSQSKGHITHDDSADKIQPA